MAIKVEIEGGQTLEFPDGTSQEVIQRVVKQQLGLPEVQQEDIAAQPISQPQQGRGRTGRARELAAQRREDREAFLSSLSSAERELIESQSPLDAFLIGAGRGITTIGRGVGLVDEEPEQVTRAIENLRQVQPSLTAGEIVGETAPFLLPATQVGRIASLPARALATGALGAAEGGIIRSGQGGDAGDIIEGASIGGAVASGVELALPVIGSIGSKIIRKATGRNPTSPLIENGQPSQELLSALDETGLTIDDLNNQAQNVITAGSVDTATAQARREFLEQQGIVPTRAQVSGTAEDFLAQQELAKSNERVRQALLGQDVAIASRFDNAIVETGGSANPSNSPVFDFIADKAIDEDAAISAAYKSARESAPTAKVVKPDNLVESIKSIAGSDNTTGGLAGAARDILKNKGLLGKKGLKIQGRVSPNVAEEIRIELNQLHDSLTPFGRSKLADLKKSLDDDVASAVGEDIFQEARAAKAKFEKDLSRVKVNKFDKRKGNIVRDILENKVNPDKFLDEVVLSKRVRSVDLEQLKRYLQLDDNPQGVDAWNSLRAESLQRIKDIAFNTVGGESTISRSSLDRALDRFGKDKMRVLFSREERKFLNDLRKVTELREPKRGTGQGFGPSSQAILRQLSGSKTGGLLRDVFGALKETREGRLILDPSIPTRDVLKPVAGASLIALPAGAAAAQENQ